jgi:protein kinase A
VLQVPSPYTPNVKGPGDFSNFDQYDEEPLKEAVNEMYPKEFAEF